MQIFTAVTEKRKRYTIVCDWRAVHYLHSRHFISSIFFWSLKGTSTTIADQVDSDESDLENVGVEQEVIEEDEDDDNDAVPASTEANEDVQIKPEEVLNCEKQEETMNTDLNILIFWVYNSEGINDVFGQFYNHRLFFLWCIGIKIPLTLYSKCINKKDRKSCSKYTVNSSFHSGRLTHLHL